MDRTFIARQIARHRQRDTAGEELAAIEHSLAEVQRKQANLARTIAAVDDAEATAPLVSELTSLGEQKRNLERVLTQLEDWCDLWRDNLAHADLALKRKILAALRVRVLLFPASRHPRWEIETDWSAALGNAEPSHDVVALHTT
jgi:hypothetical protein